MEGYINYINTVLPDEAGNKTLYDFKRKTLDEMTARANEVTSRGLTDRRVVDDLIISEYSDLAEDYEKYHTKKMNAKKARRNAILNVVGSVVYLITIVIGFLAVSFATQKWNMTWAIVVDGVLLWVVYLLSIGIRKFTSMRRIFHIFARICLAGAVIVGAVAVYLFILAITDNTVEHRWLIVIAGLILMFVCDGIYASAAKHRLAIINWLIYIPVISVFVFILIGALGVLGWGTAWLVIPLSLVADVVIIIIAIGRNKLEKLEVADTWNEN